MPLFGRRKRQDAPPLASTPEPTPAPPSADLSAPAGSAAPPGAGASDIDIPDAVLEKPKGGIFGGGKKALEDENAELRTALDAIGATELARIRADLVRLRAEHEALLASLAAEQAAARGELEGLRREVVEVREAAILQEVGIYDYTHPLESSVEFKDRLAIVREQTKAMARADMAVSAVTNWTVNGSAKEGARMVRETSKLMLRAYNNEADNAVRAMKPYALAAAVSRLDKARSTISRLGRTMQIEITDPYHRLRIEELEFTADYLAKVAEEKEREREERARLREEEQARREFEREKARLEKEAGHYRSVLERLVNGGDPAVAAEAQAKLAEIEAAIRGVEERAANTRAGYVYVISNIGSFGERMVKIGMTRRLEPMDRVRELGDASVPFRYDVHALIFSEDAVGLETQLHRALADRRVNLVNLQREFFYATPAEVCDLLERLQGNLLSFEERPEAVEWHQSENTRRAAGRAGLADTPAQATTS